MNRVLKSAVLGLAVAATTLSVLPSAQAGDRWNNRHGNYGRHYNGGYYRHGNNGDLVAAGVLGLAVGALVAGAATAPPRQYYEPAYRDYPPPPPRAYRRAYIEEPRVVYAEGALEPWSPEWYDYCQDRYRSFNARTGTFTGYDGVKRFCQAN